MKTDFIQSSWESVHAKEKVNAIQSNEEVDGKPESVEQVKPSHMTSTSESLPSWIVWLYWKTMDAGTVTCSQKEKETGETDVYYAAETLKM